MRCWCAVPGHAGRATATCPSAATPGTTCSKTVGEFARPSFLDVWFGDPQLEYRSDDGTLLRVEDRRAVEADLPGWPGPRHLDDLQIATLGSLLAALLALPLAPAHGAQPARAAAAGLGRPRACSTSRASIHTLVFGLVLVGIVGLGPTAGILAIAPALDGHLRQAVRRGHRVAGHGGRGRRAQPSAPAPLQVFFHAVWPAVLPQFVSSHLYVWEFNIRDSTILGLIGAGGLGLLITEAMALFQWGRLATLLLVVVALVVGLRCAQPAHPAALL